MSKSKARRRKKVLIVDDHPMMRQGLAQLMNHEPDLAACCEAQTAHEALALAESCRPDLVLADISLVGRSGLELIKDLRVLKPELPVLVISMHDEMLYAERVLRAGGRGYIMKQQGGKQILQAIRQVLGGEIYVSPGMSAKILEIFSGRRTETIQSPLEQLTDREFEVFQMMGQGKGSREIAQQMNLSVKTVEAHRQHLKAKLKLPDAPALVRYAVRWVESQGRE